VHLERPIIFARSNPRAQVEANPADLMAIGPFPPATLSDVTCAAAQLSNGAPYPGLSLGAIVSRVSRFGDDMCAAAAVEVADTTGLAGVKGSGIVQQLQDAMGQPEHRRIQASGGRLWSASTLRGNRSAYDADLRRT